MQGLNTKLHIIYDGKCFFCRHYISLLRLRERGYDAELISARESHPLVSQLRAEGYDLHRGMVVIDNETHYYGSQAIHHLASLTSGIQGIMLRMHYAIFKSATLSQLLYPLLLRVRLLTLYIRGIPKL